MKKYIFFSILISVLSVHINKIKSQVVQGGSQINPVVYPASPNASSLGIYGQIPINLFNGQPNISIELYKIKTGDYELPVSLSYNLASVKPDEHPGWVGLGWNLNAGGAITRLINGRPDETTVDNFNDITQFAYYDHYNTLDRTNWMNDTNMMEYYNGLRTIAPSYFLAPPAPDEFMFNVNGLSGSFFKNHKGKWVVKANQNIDIQITDELFYDFKIQEDSRQFANSNTLNIKRIIYGFTLTTPDGIKYIFGKNPNAIEFFSNSASSNDKFYASLTAKTWYLTKIILPDTKTISFIYSTASEKTGGHTANKAVYSEYTSASFLYYNTSGSTVDQSNGSGLAQSTSLVRQFITYLSKIESEEWEILFNRSLSNDLDYDLKDKGKWAAFQGYTHHYPVDYQDEKHWFKLDNFIVNNTVNKNTILKIDFSYLENPDSRLFLTGIKESGADNTYIKKHFFQYNPLPLPIYGQQKTDYWGYFNNMNFFKSVAPASGLNYNKAQLRDIYPQYKKPNFSAMQAGVLTQITYPTGGYSEFIYEPHDFSLIVNKDKNGISLINAERENETAGGLRIKKVISHSKDGNGWEKEYLYVKDYKNGNFTSSGILSGRPYCFDEGNNSGLSYWKLTESPITALSNTNGNHVTYTQVTEKDNNGGFTEYTYTNQDNGYMDRQNNRLFFALFNAVGNNFDYTNIPKQLPFNSLEIERGKLLSEKIYNKSKNLLQETNYEYNTIPDRFTDEIRQLYYFEDVYGTLLSSGPFSYYDHMKSIFKMSAYSIFTHQTYLKKKEDIFYDLSNNQNIKTTTSYTYSNTSNFHQLTSQTSTTSTGELVTKYQYPPDFPTDPVLKELTLKNQISTPVTTEVIRKEDNTEKQLSFTQTEYAKEGNLVLPKFIYAKKGDAPLEKKITYTKYDDKGNLLQYTPENGIPVSIIWGYNQLYPIAKIEGIGYDEMINGGGNIKDIVEALLFNTTRYPENQEFNLNLLNQLRVNSVLKNSMVTTYTYTPLVGVTSVTFPNGLTEYYIYDSFSRLKEIKDSEGKILKSFEYHYKTQN